MLATACGARLSDEQLGAVQVRGSRSADSRSSATGDAEPSAAPAIATPEDGQAASSAVPAAATAEQASASQGAAEPGGGNGGSTDVGVTGSEIVLGNVSTLSGPIPGLFAGAVYGTQAALAYQNSRGGLFGRKLRLEVRDDQFDAGQFRSQTSELLDKTLALVGSFSLWDDAANEAIVKSGIPDFGIPINDSRGRNPNNFSTNPIDPTAGPTGGFEWIQKRFPGSVKAVAAIYSDVAASRTQHVRMQRVAEALGWKFVYTRAFQPTETDFTADVIRMRQKGVKAVYTFAVDDKSNARFGQAMKQQGFKPDFVLTNYAPPVAEYGQDAVEGWYGTANQAPFLDPNEPSVTPEVGLMRQWLAKVKPGFKPDLFVLHTWALTRLALRAMEMAGPNLTRRRVEDAVHRIGVTDVGGIVASMNPGAKTPPVCFVMTQVKGGVFRRLDPARGFDCHSRNLRP
jgi:ABC-type branched-subunit amino acid transport system substrate-binding protein